MSTIQKIHQDFQDNYIDSDAYVLTFFKNNFIYINNTNHFKNELELSQYIDLTHVYIKTVFGKDQFNETIQFASKFLKLVPGEIKRLELSDFKTEWINEIYFCYAIANYHLKDFKTSTKILESLVDENLKNDRFKIWLLHSKHGEKKRKIKILNFVIIAFVGVSIVFEDYIQNSLLKQLFLIIGLIAILGNMAYEQYMTKKLKKLKTK